MTFVVQYWHQPDCPQSIRARRKCWEDAFPGRYELFDRKSAADFIAQHFGGGALSGFHACATPAMASDYFRYCWLAIHGGLYVDSAFLPGDPARIAAETAHPVFALSVPETDLTPGIARARKVLGKVLLNGILCTSVARCPYFALLSCLVRRLVHERASDLVPMVTGIGVLTMFDYVVSASGLDPRTTLDTLRRAAPPGNDHVLAVISAFMTDHAGDLSRLSPCASKSSVQMGEVFFRPAADQQRFSDPAHWSNYRGSIFSAARSE